MSRSRLSTCRSAVLHAAVLSGLCLGFTASRAGASGFDKAIPWSGRYAGVANAATAAVEGPESLFFNPAGLSKTQQAEIGVNISPMFAKLQGPLPTGSTSQSLYQETARRGAPLVGTLGSYKLGGRWGAGLGYYITGGLQAYYDSVDYTSLVPTATLRPTIKADVVISEIALGTGYDLGHGLRVGGAYRVLNVDAAFSSAKVMGATVLQNASFDNLKDTVYGGLRFGLQYQPRERWGLGASWRSQVDFTATGSVSAKLDNNGTVINVPASPVTATNSLPQQAAFGGFYTLSPLWKLFGEYSWTEYAIDKKLDVTGSLGGQDISVAGDITQGWKNMHIIRAGTEFSGVKDWKLRAGYAWVSRVTPYEHARATFVAPGPAHVFTLGAGRELRAGMRLDAALDYSVATGNGSNVSPVAALSENIAGGGFRTDEVTIHTGLTYGF